VVASDEGASRAVQATQPSGFERALIPRKSWLDTAQAVTFLEAILNFCLKKYLTQGHLSKIERAKIAPSLEMLILLYRSIPQGA
jgi:hypothetical protein